MNDTDNPQIDWEARLTAVEDVLRETHNLLWRAGVPLPSRSDYTLTLSSRIRALIAERDTYLRQLERIQGIISVPGQPDEAEQAEPTQRRGHTQVGDDR